MTDPTPMEYDEPIEHVEWGVMFASGEAARGLNEDTARMVVESHGDQGDLTLVKRTVTYDPWIVVPRRTRPSP